MKINEWPTITNLIFNPEHVQYIMYDEKDSQVVYMRFSDGHSLTFRGQEAIDLWRAYSKGQGWQDEET
jgi:hypothetical protein